MTTPQISPLTRSASSTSSPATAKTPYRILLIEDDAHIARMIGVNIAKARMGFRHASDAAAGLSALHEFEPHLILLDVMLPDGNGYDLCAKIRETSNVPVIMVTARTQAEDHLRGLKCGADDYITKPFDPRVLMAHIGSHLRRAHRYSITQRDLDRASQQAGQRWNQCGECHYMGPADKFEQIDERFQQKLQCPHCNAPEWSIQTDVK